MSMMTVEDMIKTLRRPDHERIEIRDSDNNENGMY